MILPTIAANFGTYTPSGSANVNLDSLSLSTAQYVRVGNIVIVSGRFTADPTSGTAQTSFEMTLPVASNLANAEDCSGTAFCGIVAGLGGEVIGVPANDTAKVQWQAVGTAVSRSWSFIFSYQVL
jgi:hypothetical protein